MSQPDIQVVRTIPAVPPPLAHWLREAARRFPQACAIETQGKRLSYAELLDATDALANRLRERRLASGDRIGIAAVRSIDTVVAILATIEAGLGYVPLDLSYPADRLRAMLEDAAPRAVLGEREALAQLRVAVGDFPTLDNPAPVQAPPHAAAPDLSYVLFTSGSTGRPKGVAMGAMPLRHLIHWHSQHARLGKAARVLQFAPLSFDVHFQEIFSTLACGGTLVLLPEAQRRDPALLLAALVEHRIERIFVPYVALQMIAEAAHDHAPAALREIVSAGEQLQVTPAIRSLFMRLAGAELHNHYGPTETHVVTSFELRGDPAAWPEIPPIGLPLPHVQLALSNALAEPGDGLTTGELLLGGDTLAHGYLGRPDLTAERFRGDLNGLSGRWYVTGDLVRRDAAGVCTYLGRADQQLKVDGFRIEPGEIELAIMAFAGVKDAVVSAPDLPGVGKQLLAHIVMRKAGAFDESALITQLRAHLRECLPEYMVPLRFVALERLPTTPSGKIDRRALPLPAPEFTTPASDDPLDIARSLWQELLGLPQIGDAQNLFDLGARSMLVMRFVTRLKDLGVQRVSVADVYDRPTIAGIAATMAGEPRARRKQHSAPTRATAGIAIVGMASRTPGAADVGAFWQNLLDGDEGIRQFALHEIDASVPEAMRSRANFVAAHGVLDNVERFDAAFFGISAREATMLDPQQRLMLELCASALEHAAIDSSRTEARIGVYAGTGNNAYAPALRQAQPELVQQYGEFATMLASEKDYVATRVANRLNLNGPALSIHTACSTSLVAVAQAWHALASGQCDVALAGGVNVAVPQINGYLHVEGGMESADGHCRPFDAQASGTVFASGGGVVVLRRLEDALASGDTIYAVIRGVGINNDGGDKASFTAPSVSGQAGAIRMALEHAQVSPRSIGYVEAHGTGTSLGDPIEVAALTRAWREDTPDNQFCGIGSVKSNLGHMAAGAGVVGLIKAALSLHREVIPGTLHFNRPNPQIDFANTPFKVVAHNTDWPRAKQARRAAVSSFGVGGTNAHVVLEEAPAPAHRAVDHDARLFVLPLSARTSQAALQRARDLADHLQRHPELALADVASTLMRGRKPMAQRLSVVASSVADAVSALRAVRGSVAALQKPRLVFLFPGQGSQHPGMARRLYDEAPAFHEALDRSLDIVQVALGVDLRPWLIHADPGDAAIAQTLAETRYAQPALFAVSYALAAWLDSLGLHPDAMIGHSIGEYAAACHAGVFSLEDAIAAVVARGQAMFDQPRGAMLAVRAGADALRPLLPEGVEIAGSNAPALTVVAGRHEAIDHLATRLEAQDIGTTKLRVSHAFHSASMDGALPGVAQALRAASLRAPGALVYSCVSGAALQAHEATDPQYWARQVRAPVQFSRAVMAELARGDAVFVEVGPGQALTALLRQHRAADGAVPRTIAVMGPAQDPGDPAVQALKAVGALWCAGVDVAWPVAASAQRVPLPTYPFEGERHWFASRPAAVQASAAAPADSIDSLIAIQPQQIVFAMSRIPTLVAELKRVLSDVSGLSTDEMATDATFVDMGLDSLSLTQATLELERVFGVKLRFRRLLEDLDNIDKLARFLDAEMPTDKFAPVRAAPLPTAAEPQAIPAALPTGAVAPSMSVPAMPAATSGADAVHQLLQQQLQLMAQQLAVLAGQSRAATQAPAALAAPAVVHAQATRTAPLPAEPAQPSITSLVEKPFGASPRLTLEAKQDFTPAQRRWLDDFIARYTARSGRSKAFSQQHRKVMADPRVVTGFNPLWKDLVYPIVVDHSKGASLWDLDGNEYIDLLACFGGNLLGYRPAGVIAAMHEQLDLGLEVGPQHPMAAEVAQLISEFTGMERVGFCNTGSEAVMGAMRIARTVTGRKTIAIFTNSYHGIFDEVIVRGTKQLRSLSAAPGILANAVEHILVLDWNSEDSLRVLRERGPELAAIMTEPIQNKYPTVQPREFVQSLRQIADRCGCALIFDEVVTGFRVAPGGAQEFYGVRADMATYGKVIGGGLPFAAIAGHSKWLDALDGGHWQYGDDSYPEAGVTYFAGTFVRHPLALAAARATLLHLKQGGREFYRRLNDRTQRLVDRLNTAFAVRGAPVKAVHCASLWRLQWDDNQKFVSLFYYLVRFHGLHLYEQFGHFVHEGMTDEHTDRIFQVFTTALDELIGLGFIMPKESGPPSQPRPDSGSKARTDAPLSPGQTERWLAGSFDASARRALNESFCVGLQHGVDKAALKAALQDVLMRHDAFRIQFDLEEPRQTLMPVIPVAVAEFDLSDQADADSALDTFCAQANLRDFPLDQAPLAAVSLLSLADGRVVVHVVASHLVFDGWASSVFNAELALAYKARSIGLVAEFKPAESPLAFAAQELARFEGADGLASLRFWQQQLHNPPAPLSLGDRMPPTPRTYAADTQRVRLQGELFARLRAQARRSGATLFQLLLTAVTVMLQRRSGQAEFVVSIPYASQSLQRHGPLMADGVLDLPLRLGCGPQDSADDVLRRVRSRLMDALEHPLMTQGTVARALNIRSAGNRPPLTGIYFNLNPKVDLSAYAPLEATMHEGRKRGTLSELFFNFYEQENALTLDLHYSTEFFSPARAQELIEAVMAQCTRFADSLEGSAGLTTTSAPMVPSATPAPVVDSRLIAWNATTTPLEPQARVEQWVSRQVAATPNAVALVAQGATLTYAALESRANRLAQLLNARGIGAGMLVGVCLPRSLDLVPALLGILKTGAAYVPLDPGFPKDRLHYMAEDAGVRLVITDSINASLTGLPRELQIRIDDDAAVLAAATDAALAPQATWPQDAPAYVIYTSGSTGQPKGVVLPQRAVCNFLASMRREPGLRSSDRLLAVTTLSFDIAVLELFLPLTTGACVVLAQREEAMDGEVLARLAATQGITVMQATPTTWHMLLDANWRAPAGFRALCGGEPLPPTLADRLLDAGVELWNMYGPTETTVWSTLCRIVDAKQKISIGHPIANTQVWVLDERLQPCAIGQEGELCIGGAGVATGYFKRAELTAEKFVADPFDGTPGARLYRTGDLARWLEDGTLEHLGRLDFQVKIRGYRIELGEIEARLAALPGVARSVVMAREDSPGDVRLVGYIVTQGEAAPDLGELRESLRAALPDYMLPQHLVTLDALPLLPNGKIDRKALPAPAGPVLASSRDITAPRTELERTVAQTMQAVLKAAELGIHDDFFSLGGHSLLAARLISQLNRDLGLRLSLRALFESPTVEKLAMAIDRLRGADAPPVRAPIVRRPDRGTAPLTLMQQRVNFIETIHPGRVVYHAPTGHRFKGPMNLEAFDKAFAEMVRRQDAFRTSIVRSGDGWVQHIDETQTLSLLPLEDLSALPETDREKFLLQRMNALVAETFLLDRSPLVRTRLFKLGENHHALFFMPHHIVWDGWSFDIIYLEMPALYEAFLAGKPSPLPELAVTYGDFAHWHNEWIKGAEIQQQLGFWQRKMETSPPQRAPFTDRPRDQLASGNGATEFMMIPLDKSEKLRSIARQTGSTVSIVFLSMYAALMSQWIRDPAPAIGLPVRGRPATELEGVMGFFNNMLPLRLPVTPAASCLDWIRAVKGMVTEAIANQDVPFEMVAQHLKLKAGNLYQVLFNYQDVRDRQLRWGELSHERISLMQDGATEDMNLWIVEGLAGISGGVQYDADMFLRSTAMAIRDRFLVLLDRLIARPEQSLDALLALDPAEVPLLDRLDATWASTSAAHDLFDLIDTHVDANPNHIAIRDGVQQLSFAELGERVRQFEAVLRSQVRAEGPRTVAVSVADPVAHVVACLAALRCGAQCLSLEAAAAPVSFDRSDLVAVVCDAWLEATLPAGCVKIASELIPGARAMPRRRQARWSAAGAARIALDRPTLSAIAVGLATQASLRASERALCVDASQRALLLAQACMAMTTGAEVLITSAEISNDGARLASLVRSENIRVMHAGSDTWRKLLEQRGDQPLNLIAQIDVAESSPELVTALLAAGATVMSMYRPFNIGVPLASSAISHEKDTAVFGHPFVARSLAIVDAVGRRVPEGIPGELQITGAGDGASHGTGSLVRWRSDGVLQYLGETGKTGYLAGNHVDLDIIERRLFAHAEVNRAIVTIKNSTAGRRSLVAYVVPNEAMPSASLLAEHVSAELPEHMVPEMFIELRAVPLLLNGEVNQDLLPSPERADPESTQGAVRPRSEAESALSEIWRHLLDVSDVRPNDNFFDLGGNSLLAMHAVEESRRVLGFRVDASRYVFETLAQLSTADSPAPLVAETVPMAKQKGLLTRVFGAWGQRAGK